MRDVANGGLVGSRPLAAPRTPTWSSVAIGLFALACSGSSDAPPAARSGASGGAPEATAAAASSASSTTAPASAPSPGSGATAGAGAAGPSAPAAPTRRTVPGAAHGAPATPEELARARATLDGLRNARRLLHDGHATEALAAFRALATASPDAPALRCETGLVAYRAGELELAASEIEAGVRLYGARARRSRSLGPHLAMCLYNRGLVAEARGRVGDAAAAYRDSIELRPNATVAARLGALGETASAELDATPPAASLAAALAEVRGDCDEDHGCSFETQEHASPTDASLTLALVTRRQVDPEYGTGCAVGTAIVSEPRGAFVLGETLYDCSEGSIFDAHGEVGAPTFVHVAGHARDVVALVITSYGSGEAQHVDAEIVTGTSETLLVCADADLPIGWRCATVPLSEHEETDCWNLGGCDEEAEDDDAASPDEGEENDDDNETDEPEGRVLESWGWSAGWNLEPDGTLVVTQLASEGEDAHPPLVGRTPLETVLAEWALR